VLVKSNKNGLFFLAIIPFGLADFRRKEQIFHHRPFLFKTTNPPGYLYTIYTMKLNQQMLFIAVA